MSRWMILERNHESERWSYRATPSDGNRKMCLYDGLFLICEYAFRGIITLRRSWGA